MDLYDIAIAKKLSGGSGGGGGDFSTAEVTFSSDGSDTFDLTLHPFDSDNMLPVLDYNSGAIIDDLSGISLESDNIEVSGSSVKRTVYIVKDSYVIVNQTDWGLVTVTGNAEIVPIEDNGDTYYLVKITGSCTIHSVGSK